MLAAISAKCKKCLLTSWYLISHPAYPARAIRRKFSTVIETWEYEEVDRRWTGIVCAISPQNGLYYILESVCIKCFSLNEFSLWGCFIFRWGWNMTDSVDIIVWHCFIKISGKKIFLSTFLSRMGEGPRKNSFQRKNICWFLLFLPFIHHSELYFVEEKNEGVVENRWGRKEFYFLEYVQLKVTENWVIDENWIEFSRKVHFFTCSINFSLHW